MSAENGISGASMTFVTDPAGRKVSLEPNRWSHILDAHPELAPYKTEILATVHAPTSIRQGRRPIEEWFYREGVGPSKWLKVIVDFDGDRGRIITAFARRRIP